MKAHPDDLKQLLAKFGYTPSAALDSGHGPQLSTFFGIAEALEPGLVLDEDRIEWRIGMDRLRFLLSRWQHGTPAGAMPSSELLRLGAIAECRWRGPARGDRRELPFIRDAALRGIAERDFATLVAARQHEEIKTAIIMAGSVIEAILADAVERDLSKTTAASTAVQASRAKKNPRVWGKFNAHDIDSWTLAQLVAVAGPDGLRLLSERAEQMAEVVRDWRNFVHPRKERDATATAPLGLSDAKAAEALVERVLEEIQRTITP